MFRLLQPPNWLLYADMTDLTSGVELAESTTVATGALIRDERWENLLTKSGGGDKTSNFINGVVSGDVSKSGKLSSCHRWLQGLLLSIPLVVSRIRSSCVRWTKCCTLWDGRCFRLFRVRACDRACVRACVPAKMSPVCAHPGRRVNAQSPMCALFTTQLDYLE